MAKILSDQEKIRYSRHLNIPDIGLSGQIKIKASSVLIAGCGGLGSASTLYLAAAGIGKIGLVDSDVVELSNLQRQVIHSVENIDQPKVISAQNRIVGLNPNVEVEAIHDRITDKNTDSILGEYPIVVDATDNFETRYILNKACVRRNIPFVYGAIFQFSGQMSVFWNIKGPCFHCVFSHTPTPEYSASNRGVGVIGALPGIIGALQAVEVIKMITQVGESMVGKILLYDGLETKFQDISVKKDPHCPVCSG